jgi:hypothetical protein
MYSDEELDSAVNAGVISAEAAAALRAHIGKAQSTHLADEEHFRLVTSFNDIFVAIAGLLVLVAVGWIAGSFEPHLIGVAVAATAWGLAEFFTRKRGMALPSILFLLAFAAGVFAAVMPTWRSLLAGGTGEFGMGVAIAAAVTTACTWMHWRRFRVPITVAAGAAALDGVAIGLLLALAPNAFQWLNAIVFVAGLSVFAFAMYWDMSDPLRTTRRADVAFWLHLLAAPLIVHPVFKFFSLFTAQPGIGSAAVVVILYVAMGIVALVIDRRALMVSALLYVLAAIGTLLGEFGAAGINVALTALIIGSALLMLSAFWHASRAGVVKRLSEDLQRRLPPLR